MKNKKVFIPIILVLLLLVGGYFFLIKEDKVTNLNLFEKQWIENNKNKIIDMSIVNDIPILSYTGEGIILEYLNSLNNETGLSFNKISYKLNEEVKSEYSFKMVDDIKDNEILVYTDNYVLVTKDKTYLNLDEINNLNIGVLSGNLDKVNNYLYDTNSTYTPFESIDLMIEEYNKEDTTLNAIVLLKTVNLKSIIDNNYVIAYHINDYKKNFVLSLGNDEKLNSILTKYYNKWSSKNYESMYNRYLSKNYFSFKNINDSDTVKFRSKRYNYGFISNAPFDFLLDGKLTGVNSQLLSDFSKLTNAEISYKKYDSITDLLNAFNANKIDLFYEINSNKEYALDVYNTNKLYNNNIFVLKHSSNNQIIDSIKSLKDVYVLDNSELAYYLSNAEVSIKTFKSMDELLKKADENSVILIDTLGYNYYKNTLENFVISYQFDINDYSFVIRDIEDNKLFGDMFNFYISFVDTDKYVNLGLRDLILVDKTPIILKNTALLLGSVVVILLVVLAIIKIKPKSKRNNFSKEDKLRYIDALTSLKNRNYLNDSIENWDSNDTYPQAIVIIDLNNIAYINDNYGHAEGDMVINQAANILIVNQVENSEIVRTNGNEFLIYLVGHEEKNVISYMRKINKELKELKHGFGAAIGYSMINDDIKTIDDAINEATLDMKSNKEEIKE